jgi:phosphatidylserine synthase
MCAVGGTSNLNNLNATKQPPPGAECSRQRGYSLTPLPISSEATFLSLTYHKNASERPIVVLAGLVCIRRVLSLNSVKIPLILNETFHVFFNLFIHSLLSLEQKLLHELRTLIHLLIAR